MIFLRQPKPITALYEVDRDTAEDRHRTVMEAVEGVIAQTRKSKKKAKEVGMRAQEIANSIK